MLIGKNSISHGLRSVRIKVSKIYLGFMINGRRVEGRISALTHIDYFQVDDEIVTLLWMTIDPFKGTGFDISLGMMPLS